MKNWVFLLLFAFVICSCGTPKASVLQKSPSVFLVSVDKKATSPMDVIDVQLSDGEQWVSGSFQYIDESGSGEAILSSKGYDSFGLLVSAPKLPFNPIKAMVSYRTEKDGIIKSILVEFDSNN
uniref:Secreted protein n=1 Tax=uncultured Flavobacteriia bacterium TaxID=212695 RepID=F4MLT6_9BACT|nr:hypothetical protein [uncultured bacterium]CBL87099.1 hypothetical protein S3_816_0001 [uncultured Flavobacteriia bacterium]